MSMNEEAITLLVREVNRLEKENRQLVQRVEGLTALAKSLYSIARRSSWPYCATYRKACDLLGVR